MRSSPEVHAGDLNDSYSADQPADVEGIADLMQWRVHKLMQRRCADRKGTYRLFTTFFQD
jgi:hypothetical protein